MTIIGRKTEKKIDHDPDQARAHSSKQLSVLLQYSSVHIY
jgi:hypothetical protein